MNAQGYIIKENIVYQDNKSAIKMEKNGRNSCTGNSRHVSIQYFFLKDRVNKGEVDIRYSPSEYILADYFTKALQGKIFLIHPDVIMGYKPLICLEEQISTNKERVERKSKMFDAKNLKSANITVTAKIKKL